MSTARRPRHVVTRAGTARVAVGLAALLVAGQLASGLTGTAATAADARAAATYIDLGTASTYSVLGGTGVSNTGAATVLSGDLGLSPAGVIAFGTGVVGGTTHDKDEAAETAQADRAEAYDAALAQVSTTTFAGDQAARTFKPGVHTTTAAFTNTGTITLDADGDPSAVFVFQVGAALSSAASTKVVLTDGALANNVYWQVVGAVSLGAGAKFVGTFLGAGAISFGEGASLKGRALTPGTVALANSPVTEPVDDRTAPVVTIVGGAARSTDDATPTIAGTTDEPTGTAVTVTVADQTLSTIVGAGGAWSVGATTLTEGPHDVLATVVDASRNPGTAAQVLTVDLGAPAVQITGGPTAATKDTTPTLSGTTDEPAGTAVTVALAGQVLTTTAGGGGAWSTTTAPLTEAAHGVLVSVTDAAGNTGTATQVLTVDTTVPVVTIDGGAARSTVDRSPWTYGTTAERAGTTVVVTVGGQTLTATVRPGGTWGVSAEALPRGAYPVVATLTDEAANTGTATQVLTITGAGDPGDPTEPTGPTDPTDPGQPATPATPTTPTTPTTPAAPVAPTSAPPTSTSAAVHRHDAAIRVGGKGAWTGSGSYASGQEVATRLRKRSATFQVQVTNRGGAADQVLLRGTRGSRAFSVTYVVAGSDVTGQVTAGTYRTAALAPGASAVVVVTVTRTRKAGSGAKRTVRLGATSVLSPSARDDVTARVRT